MLEFFKNLFDTSDFPARWTCGHWSQAHGWLHIASDLAIAAAYAAMPLAIVLLMRRRRDLSYPRIYWLFAGFILSCGLVHLIDATLFWNPWYRLSGVAKVVTAVVSWATVFAVVRILPHAMEITGVMPLAEKLGKEAEERRKAEEEVRRLNMRLSQRVEELEALLDVIPVGIGIASDPACLHIRINRAFTEILRLDKDANASLGGPAHERPKNFRVFRGDHELAPDELPIQVAARSGKVIRAFEEEVVFEDGTKITLLSSAAPLFDEERRVRGAVGASIDISATKRAEEEHLKVERKLLDAQKRESLGVLAGGIAHDFNNLLTVVLGNASLARTELSPVSPIHVYVEQIEKSAKRASDLCKQMLAYAGKGRFVLEDIDLSELVTETTSLLQASISKRVRLVLQLADPIPAVRGDATQIRQIVMNLVINASEAIGERDGQVTIHTGELDATEAYLATTFNAAELVPGRYCFIEVGDDGCGMAPEILARVFDPFFTTKFTGRGLGLAAVLGIVRGHKGTIKIYSEAGQGTTFKVLLPASGDAARAVAATPKPRNHWRGTGTILVVDDEENVRRVAVKMVEQLGFSAVQAGDGREGLMRFTETEGIVAVLMDLTMPRMDGAETFRELRLIRPDVKVLLMSGFNEQETINRFTGKGLAGFLQKPFRIEDLQEKLRIILDPTA